MDVCHRSAPVTVVGVPSSLVGMQSTHRICCTIIKCAKDFHGAYRRQTKELIKYTVCVSQVKPSAMWCAVSA